MWRVWQVFGYEGKKGSGGMRVQNRIHVALGRPSRVCWKPAHGTCQAMRQDISAQPLSTTRHSGTVRRRRDPQAPQQVRSVLVSSPSTGILLSTNFAVAILLGITPRNCARKWLLRGAALDRHTCDTETRVSSALGSHWPCPDDSDFFSAAYGT